MHCDPSSWLRSDGIGAASRDVDLGWTETDSKPPPIPTVQGVSVLGVLLSPAFGLR